MSRHFLVVGAGLAGLATALRLAHRGHRVTVLEKTDQVGGRNRELKVNDCTFDAGPTLMLMLDPFRKLFADVGERMEDHLDLVLCDPHYRVFFPGRQALDCTSDAARMAANLERFSGRDAAAAFPKMLADLKALYEESMPLFVRRNYDSPLDLLTARGLWTASKHRILGNLERRMRSYFEDPRLQTLFCLQTMYLGLSPLQAPFVYGVLAYMEYGEGIWYPMGGMVEICRAVARLAVRKGVEIRPNTPVKKIEKGAVVLESGERLAGDAVICNADLPYAEKELLGKPAKNRRYSCSGYMMYLDYEGELPSLLHHNIVLTADFHRNLEQVFERFEVPDDPSFYAAVSGRTDRQKAPDGHLNLFLLVPYPNLSRPFVEGDGRRVEERVFSRLERDFGFDRARVRGIRRVTPADWQEQLNLDRGASFGLSHDLLQSVCFRPGNKSPDQELLYFVGASTVPGNGLPMVLISAELAEARLIQDGLLA